MEAGPSTLLRPSNTCPRVPHPACLSVRALRQPLRMHPSLVHPRISPIRTMARCQAAPWQLERRQRRRRNTSRTALHRFSVWMRLTDGTWCVGGDLPTLAGDLGCWCCLLPECVVHHSSLIRRFAIERQPGWKQQSPNHTSETAMHC